MLDLKNMKTEELNNLLNKIKEELANRNKSKIIYNCDARTESNTHLTKYRHWAKIIRSIDSTKINGYAFVGDFLNIRTENLVNKNDYILELQDDNKYFLYKAIDNYKKELVLEGHKNDIITFIRKCAEIINK